MHTTPQLQRLIGLALAVVALAVLALPGNIVAADNGDTCGLAPTASPRILPKGHLEGINFSWSAVPNATLYLVKIYGTNGQAIWKYVDWTALYYGVGDLGVGTFTWSVTAFDASGNMLCEEDGTFGENGATSSSFTLTEMCPPEGCQFAAPLVCPPTYIVQNDTCVCPSGTFEFRGRCIDEEEPQ